MESYPAATMFRPKMGACHLHGVGPGKQVAQKGGGTRMARRMQATPIRCKTAVTSGPATGYGCGHRNAVGLVQLRPH